MVAATSCSIMPSCKCMGRACGPPRDCISASSMLPRRCFGSRVDTSTCAWFYCVVCSNVCDRGLPRHALVDSLSRCYNTSACGLSLRFGVPSAISIVRRSVLGTFGVEPGVLYTQAPSKNLVNMQTCHALPACMPVTSAYARVCVCVCVLCCVVLCVGARVVCVCDNVA